ncbi:MAG TPA: PilZ domain-containing protein [Novosphingobium sp.]|nr:PilZ domain-containing protein [Novosphingobium sp.]HZV08423.1 PilZ domain-containing protein [Novosphingobium sp.]
MSPDDTPFPAPDPQPADSRIAARESLLLMADCRLVGDARIVRVKLRNLSASGIMAESQLVPARGAAIAIDLRNIGWVEGVVAWVQAPRFGVAFRQEINPALVRQLPASDQPDCIVRRPLAVRLKADRIDPGRIRSI